MALDRFGRNIQYLRISLTDHCNLRCIYCMPDGMIFHPNAELMQNDEILTFTRLFAGLGFDKIRLTGGEPTLRANLVELVRGISHTDGIRSVSMTTNAVLLPNLASPLAKAGLQRVNISIDTLDPLKFKQLTGFDNLENVWKGILSAERAGLGPIKLNVVVVRGFNEQDVAELARLTIQHAWQVRFIEMMPFAGKTDFQTGQMVTAVETHSLIEHALGRLMQVNNQTLDGEARLYRLPGALGTIGFIYSVTAPFCGSCNRVRLTADGALRLCLLRESELDLLTPLRNGASQDQLRQMVLEAVYNKPWGHALDQGEIPLNRVLNEIGG